jgi:hypothetical protein
VHGFCQNKEPSHGKTYLHRGHRTNSGKTTTCIGLIHLAQKKYRRVGFIKPLGPKPVRFHRSELDKDAVLIAQVFELEKELRWMSPVVVHPGTTRRVVDGEIDTHELQKRIMHAYAELEKSCDFIIGSKFGDDN